MFRRGTAQAYSVSAHNGDFVSLKFSGSTPAPPLSLLWGAGGGVLLVTPTTAATLGGIVWGSDGFGANFVPLLSRVAYNRVRTHGAALPAGARVRWNGRLRGEGAGRELMGRTRPS